MKGRNWEGGIRVPMIARLPGKIPAGRVSHEPCATIDLFPTALAVAGIDVPDDRVIDGRNILQLMQSDASSPHEALYSIRGPNLMTVRSGRWKLHVRSPGGVPDRGDDWVDPRVPDGVTILAPYEQARPSEYPGVLGGDGPKEMMLFDLASDPSEQHDVASSHPDVVARLKKRFDAIEREVSARVTNH